MVSLERTVVDEGKLKQIEDSNKIKNNNGNGNGQQTSSQPQTIASSIDSPTEEMQLLIMSLEQRLQRVEKSNYGNKIVPLKEFNDIGRLLEGDDVHKFIEKVRVFRGSSDIMSLRMSYKQMCERSLMLLNECELILNKMTIERDGIKNLMGRIQESVMR